MSSDEVPLVGRTSSGAPAVSSERRLRVLNVAAALLQAATGCLMVVLVDRDATVPVYTNFPLIVPGERTVANQRPAPRHWTNVSVGLMSAVFLFLSAANHAFVASPCVFQRHYLPWLRQGRNPVRWAEYSVSASLMHVQIALLCGIYDLHLLFTIFALTALTMLFGALQEALPGEPSMFWWGCVPHVANWAVIACYFFRTVQHASPPDFVWSILFIILALDSVFAVTAYMQQQGKCGRGTSSYRAETVYIMLSLAAKQSLAWLQFWGAQSMDNE